MIYVTVGEHCQSFDRLITKIDEIVPSFDEKIVLQKGPSNYRPENMEYFDFTGPREAEEYIKQARLVVSHAGIGTIILAQKHRVPIIITPRRKMHGEHLNDHQTQICQAMKMEKRANIFVVEKMEDLKDRIKSILSSTQPIPGRVHNGRDKIINEIKDYLNSFA